MMGGRSQKPIDLTTLVALLAVLLWHGWADAEPQSSSFARSGIPSTRCEIGLALESPLQTICECYKRGDYPAARKERDRLKVAGSLPAEDAEELDKVLLKMLWDRGNYCQVNRECATRFQDGARALGKRETEKALAAFLSAEDLLRSSYNDTVKDNVLLLTISKTLFESTRYIKSADYLFKIEVGNLSQENRESYNVLRQDLARLTRERFKRPRPRIIAGAIIAGLGVITASFGIGAFAIDGSCRELLASGGCKRLYATQNPGMLLFGIGLIASAGGAALAGVPGKRKLPRPLEQMLSVP